MNPLRLISRAAAEWRRFYSRHSNAPWKSHPGFLDLAFAFTVLLGPWHFAQAAVSPPEFLSYQGFLVDANNTPIGDAAPANLAVEFRIYKHATSTTAGNLLWAESQTVTFSKGNFSVMLGNGTGLASGKHEPLSTVLKKSEDFYLEIQVSDTTITPRQRLLTSAFAFLATSARSIVDSAGTAVLTVESASTLKAQALEVTGNIQAAAFAGNGANVTDLNGASITTGTISSNRIPNLNASKINAGTLGDARLSANIPRLNATVKQTFSNEVAAASFSTSPPGSFSGYGTIPIGGIIMWSNYGGNPIPDGWRLCDGDEGTPDLTSKFIIGGNISGTTYKTNTTGGTSSFTLTARNIPQHRHQVDDGVMITQITDSERGNLPQDYVAQDIPGTDHFGSTDNDNNNNFLIIRQKNYTYQDIFEVNDRSNGGDKYDEIETPDPISLIPPYYALAFIMRTK